MQKTISNLIKVPLYVFGFVVIGFLFAYLTFKLMSFSRTVDVPDLAGKSLVEANEILSKKGLNLKIEGEDHDPSVPAGNILRQDVPSGSRVKEQRGIKVILSKGPRAQSVPSVAGETLDKAESLFMMNGLRISRVIRVHSNSVEKNKVIAQKPLPDEKIADKITLVVSSGPYEVIYYCPDFQGKSRENAASLAERLGLILKFSGSGETVKSQRPRPGARVKSGDVINIELAGEPIS